MPRSASTWSYNVAMGLLRRAGGGRYVYGSYDEDVAHFIAAIPPNIGHAVLKCHILDSVGHALVELRACRVIFTWRDPADAAVSFMRMFNHDFDHSLSVMKSSLELYRFHRHSGNAAILKYDDIMAQPAESIERIAMYLGLGATAAAIKQVAEETSFERMRERAEKLNERRDDPNLIKMPDTTYDPETLLNLNHIRDGSSGYGAGQLAPDQLVRINRLREEFARA
ncbi:MAG TPA: sulfotransferase domain-containing protein [Candidatus Binataceae bacterium]|nr:sulfotransferase domain-containing protein [Candidatus Binataceae bacterium]